MSFRSFIREAGHAARANLIPGLILQVGAAALLIAYYTLPAFRPGFEWFAEQKLRFGYGYSAIATGISGGLVPFLYQLWKGQIKKNALKSLLFYLGFWVCMGLQVDIFYRLQGMAFGQGSSLSVLIPKVVVDQFVFTPFWSIPQTTICYLWKNLDFDFATLRPKLNRNMFLHDIPGLVVSAWLVWIPAVTIIYCLPAQLQIPMFSLVLCFWSLLAEVINSRQRQRHAN